jgi:hypothetical protein
MLVGGHFDPLGPLPFSRDICFQDESLSENLHAAAAWLGNVCDSYRL